MESKESLHGRLTEVLKENYGVELSGSTEVQTGKYGTEPTGDNIFILNIGMKIMNC